MLYLDTHSIFQHVTKKYGKRKILYKELIASLEKNYPVMLESITGNVAYLANTLTSGLFENFLKAEYSFTVYKKDTRETTFDVDITIAAMKDTDPYVIIYSFSKELEQLRSVLGNRLILINTITEDLLDGNDSSTK